MSLDLVGSPSEILALPRKISHSYHSEKVGRYKRMLKKLQKKASELSTILGSEAAQNSAATSPYQAGSSSSSSCTHMPSFRRQFTLSSNLFRGKGKWKGKSVVKGPFMRDGMSRDIPRSTTFKCGHYAQSYAKGRHA